MHVQQYAKGENFSKSARRMKLEESALEGVWLCVAQASCSGAAVFALQPIIKWVNHLEDLCTQLSV